MRRIVFAWEFGGGMGHIQRILPLAKKMQERGHEVICVMKHVISAEGVLGKHDIKIIQAPVWQTKVKQLPTSYSYSDTLVNLGYLVRGAPLSIAKAWRNLFDNLKPDLIIMDHAPTALIATHGSGFKRALYGTGFLSPPKQSPMPSIIPWVKPPDGVLEYSEEKMLQVINDVLKELGAPFLRKLYDLFEVDENFLATFQELDHYQDREPVKYWGPVLSLAEGEKPDWPKASSDRKIFCYVKTSYPLIGMLMEELQQVDAAILVYIPNLPEKEIAKAQGTNLNLLDKPADMHAVCKECDLVICHGGHGTTAVTLLHGKPLLFIPEHDQLEQMLTGFNLAKSKYGVMITTKLKERGVIKSKIEKLLDNPVFIENAKKFADKYKDFSPEAQIDEIADRCEELMGTA
jgi:UDP:flavonoid glycosyltransferase YjiC (YdhE family)